MGLHERPLDVGSRSRIGFGALVEVPFGEKVRFGPIQELENFRAVVLLAGELQKLRPQKRPGGKRLAGDVGMSGVPPQPTPIGVPAGLGDERKGALGFAQIAAHAGGAVSVEKGKPPPAVVVEPGGRVPPIAWVGRKPWVRLQRGVPVALSALGKRLHSRAMRGRGRGDVDRVERLEQRRRIPDRGQRIAFAVIQATVIPAQPPVPPQPLGARSPQLRRSAGRSAAVKQKRHAPQRAWGHARSTTAAQARTCSTQEQLSARAMPARTGPQASHQKQAKSARSTTPAGRPPDGTVFDLGTLAIVSVSIDCHAACLNRVGVPLTRMVSCRAFLATLERESERAQALLTAGVDG